jgi:hypothetical protein
MFDLALQQIFVPIISAGLIARGYSGIVVQQAAQPITQGVNSNPTVYFIKLFDKLYGWQKRDNFIDPDTGDMMRIAEQWRETTFQVNTLVTQDPANLSGYTASDLANIVASILIDASTITNLADLGIGLLRVTDVRNPYFTDDRDRFEASPSFDFTLTHKDTRVVPDEVIQSTLFGIYPI